MEGFAPSSLALGTLLLVSAFLTATRSRIPDHKLGSVNSLVRVACGAQLLHFVEEAVFGLHVRLPGVFGLPEIPFPFFVAINVSVLVIWLYGSFQRVFDPLAILTFWFLGLASVFNLLGHPALALLTGGYFPGLFTSPLVGVMGILLVRRLLQVTRTPVQDTGP